MSGTSLDLGAANPTIGPVGVRDGGVSEIAGVHKPPKDLLRAQLMKSMAPAPHGMKKVWDKDRRVVRYVLKTPKEMMR
jgi:hypothetical protein